MKKLLGYPRQKAEGERFCLGFKIGQIYNLFRISLRESLVPSYARCCFILFVLLPLAPLFCTSTVATVHVHRSCRHRCCAHPPQLPPSLLCVSTASCRRCCARPPPLLCASTAVVVCIHYSCRRLCCARPPRCYADPPQLPPPLLCASIAATVHVRSRCCARPSPLLCASTAVVHHVFTATASVSVVEDRGRVVLHETTVGFLATFFNLFFVLYVCNGGPLCFAGWGRGN